MTTSQDDNHDDFDTPQYCESCGDALHAMASAPVCNSCAGLDEDE